VPRYRFGEFVLSPRRRLLLRHGREQPLIPRYFDLLVFLVERRHEAVHRRDIFDRVWTDVVVSDSALTQAIRTIRRTLGDDPRGPRFIRTVSRHGYRFVYPELAEEQDDDSWPGDGTAADGTVEPGARHEPAPDPESPGAEAGPLTDPYEPLIERITRVPAEAADEDDQQEAAELLHALGTAEALRRLDGRPRHAFARALLRDTRWAVAEAGTVPILGQPAPIETSWALVRLRLRRASRIAAARWASASIGGAAAGAVGGAAGGLIVLAAPDSAAPVAVLPVLAAIGACCGAAGGAGTGAGVSAAEAVARSNRAMALTVGGALGGSLVGLTVQWLTRWTLSTLVGIGVDVGGAIEGLALGGGAGLGYAMATIRAEEGLAAPRGRGRARVVALTALACGAAALALTLSGRPLVGGTIHAIGATAQRSQAILTPLARLIGEPDFGPLTSAIVGTGEGALFGLGFALGLTRRPR
jgi:DNA-binding winged helix-turn-helix (wHTH) protein